MASQNRSQVWRQLGVACAAAIAWSAIDHGATATANGQAAASAPSPAQSDAGDQTKTSIFDKFPPPVVTRGGAPAGTLDLEANPTFDPTEYNNDMRLTFGHLHGYWSGALPQLGRAFAPPKRFYQYNEADRSVPQAGVCNGRSMGPNNAFYCGADDTIHWHGPFVIALYTKFGDFAAAYVWAHEYAHAMQQRLGRLSRDRYSIQRELEADCLAGAWSGWAERVAKIIEPGDIDEAVLAMFNSRDKVGTPWFDASAHGTAQQRISAFSRGYEQNSPKVCLGR